MTTALQIPAKARRRHHHCSLEHGTTVSSDEGYAPADATDLHIKVGLGNWGSFDGYFLSNTSVNTSYSKWVFVDSHSITSARYTKTGANTAKIEFSYAASDYFKGQTKTIELTFTSSAGGTATSGQLESGVFTVEKFSKAEAIEAPYDLSGLRLSVPHAGESYFVFGTGTGNHYPITKYKGTVGIGTLSATYNRISDTRAIVTITKKTEHFSTDEIYELDFYTSTSGKYTFRSDHGSFGSSSWTGDFTLK